MPRDVDADIYAEAVLQSEIPVLVDFWAPSCGSCMLLMPAIAEMEAKYGSRMQFVKVDASQNRRLCLNQKIFSLPTFLLMVGGEEVARCDGMNLQARDVEAQIEALLASRPAQEADAS